MHPSHVPLPAVFLSWQILGKSPSKRSRRRGLKPSSVPSSLAPNPKASLVAPETLPAGALDTPLRADTLSAVTAVEVLVVATNDGVSSEEDSVGDTTPGTPAAVLDGLFEESEDQLMAEVSRLEDEKWLAKKQAAAADAHCCECWGREGFAHCSVEGETRCSAG